MARSTGTHRRGPRLTTRRADLTTGVVAVGLGVIAGSSIITTSSMWGTPGGTATSLGTVAAMVGTYLCLVLLLFISRVPWLEREMGHDRMVVWHRTVAPLALALIFVHVALTGWGFAQAAQVNVGAEIVRLVTTYPWMMPAAVAFGLMMLLGLASYRGVRSRMKYETWWASHLYFYLAVVLAFGHQIEGGIVLTQHPLIRIGWVALYVAVFGTILVSRFAIPVVSSLRHDLRVWQVVPEGHDMVSIYLTGRNLERINARGGQFFQWRFLTRTWWWQAHPYSLSAGPTNEWLRITVKDLGDQSHALATSLHRGTRVIAEGPYGVFTAERRHSDRVVAIAAGVGITPIRAMLDDLNSTTDVTVLVRANGVDSVPLRRELEELAARSGWRVWYLAGSRDDHPLTAEYLSGLAPHLAHSDVYVCGPEAFTDAVLRAARDAGVAEWHLHHESFAL
ncbi:MAG: hypothetical protein F2842_09995 [Actinobacteria bacterium]|uniref:Unannotated protein n=1 Tax=freshwater metagenome TaxID=449393 RepID=A0A6J7L4N9_9ZZZZ|nr:hypothetical protein [Actinomycetota bacterium]